MFVCIHLKNRPVPTRVSISLSTHSLSLSLHAFLSVHLFFSHPHPSFSGFSNPSLLLLASQSFLTSFLLSLSLSQPPSVSPLTPFHLLLYSLSWSLVHLHPRIHYIPTDTHTHTLVCLLYLHLLHCCLTVDPSFCLQLPLNLYY